MNSSEKLQYEKDTTAASDVLSLLIGTTISQIILVILTPVITRIYGPEAYGLYALFFSISSIISIIAGLRYELAIMLPKSDEEAANLLGLSVLFITVISIVLSFLVLFGGSSVSQFLNSPGLANYIWLLPASVFLSGIILALTYWNSRMRHYNRLAVARITGSAGCSGSQTSLGLAGINSGGGLIAGNIIGQLFSACILSGKVLYEDRHMLGRAVRWKDIRAGFTRYINFPLFDTWSALLSTFSYQLPIFLLTFFFTATTVGYYSLAFTVIQLPMSIIGASVAQVFFQQAAVAKHEDLVGLSQIVEKTVQRLISISIFPLLLLMLIGGELFTVIFGASWTEAGFFAQIMAGWIFFAFLCSPISSLFSIFEKQKYTLLFGLIVVSIQSIALVIGGMLENEIFTILLFSIVGMLVYSVGFVWLMKISRVSLMKIWNLFVRQSINWIPLIFFVVAIKFIFINNILLQVALSLILLIPYYVLVIKQDQVLRTILADFLRKMKIV